MLRSAPQERVSKHAATILRDGRFAASSGAMTVNERWRICFEFRKGDAYEVEIVDYHRG